MRSKRLMKKLIVFSTSATMLFRTSGSVYANTQALPNGTIVNQNGKKYLIDSNEEKYYLSLLISN